MFGFKGAKRQKTYRAPDGAQGRAAAKTGVMSGIVSGTRVATALGWRDVASLQEGDLVLSFDGGLQPVKSITRTPLWSGPGACPQAFWPLLVPAGVLENEAPLTVLPRQGVMLESDAAEDVFGDPFALVSAAVLDGVHGIERVFPQDDMIVVTLHFDCEQVVFASHGTLMFCPAGGDLFDFATSQSERATPSYNMLPEAFAQELVQTVAA